MPEQRRRTSTRDEPSIADLLSDPVCQALMRADRVSLKEFVALVTWLESAHAAPHPTWRCGSIVAIDRRSDPARAIVGKGAP